MNAELTFGEWLGDRLDELGFTQSELADAVGVVPSAVHRWLHDQSEPSTNNCDRIADALGIDRNEVRRRAGRRQIIQAAFLRNRGANTDATGGDVKRQWDALGRVIPEEQLKPLVDYLKRVYGIDL